MLYTGTNSVVGQLHFRNRLIEERLDCGYQKWGWMKVGGAGGGALEEGRGRIGQKAGEDIWWLRW